MDRIDLTLCQLLLSNCRTPYQDLADTLGLSVNAVHKRVKAMVEAGVIRTFTARVGLSALSAVTVWVFGRSDSPEFENLHEELARDEQVYWVSYSSGGYVYVGGYLQDMGHLEGFSSHVASVARMREPTVGILAAPQQNPARRLQPLDLAIIRALHKDARKPVSEVAAEVKASSRTVQRRLDRMVEQQLIELSLDWYPDASDDIVSLGHVRLAAGVDKVTAGGALLTRFAPHFLFSMYFNNLPGQLVSFIWVNSMRELKDLKEAVLKEEGIEALTVNVLSTGYILDTWRDKMLFEKG